MNEERTGAFTNSVSEFDYWVLGGVLVGLINTGFSIHSLLRTSHQIGKEKDGSKQKKRVN